MKKIAVTGYYGTGSSAVIDLLSEVEGIKPALGIRYEHTNLDCSGGLFDLEARLFHPNAGFYSRDIALNDFIDEMQKQYKNNFGWYGSYKKKIGPRFIDSVNEFINSISTTGGTKGLTHTIKRRFSPVKVILQIGARIVLGKRWGSLGCKYVHDKNPQRYLTVSHDEFLTAAQKFVSEYFDMCQIGTNDMIYDHLLTPEQCNVVSRYFDDDFRLIIVDRDPRDVYISDRYFWSTTKFGKQIMPMPREINLFCSYWAAMHNRTSLYANNKNILIIQFEDLIYRYDETVDKILRFCDISAERHINKKRVFNPEKSINNTQVFSIIPEAENFCNVLKQELPYLLYEFPYKNDVKKENVFDN